MNFHLVTLFPESTESYLNASILKRAQEKGLINIKYYNPRDFVEIKDAKGKKVKRELTYAERRVDNRPYGGGPGMVIEALPVMNAIEAAILSVSSSRMGFGRIVSTDRGSSVKPLKDSKVVKSINKKPVIKIIFFSPSGKQFTNEVAETFKKYTDIIFVCGRYEGIDARVKKAFPMIDISVGPYVVTGGELAAMIVIDTVTRRIPGVLGDIQSIEEERVASPDVYTRPEVVEFKKKKYRVPKILLSGHHQKMEEWRKEKKEKGKK